MRDKFKDLKIKEEFRDFIKSYGILSVALGIVMGNAIAKVINAIVDGLVMPLIEIALTGSKWEEAALNLGKVHLRIGPVIASLLNLFAISLVAFLIVRYILRLNAPKKEAEVEDA